MMRNPSHPGHVLRDLWLDDRSASAAAERLGVDLGESLQLLDGDCPLAPEIALELEAIGWSNAPFWMRLQANYDLAQARLRLERNGQLSDSEAPRSGTPVAVATQGVPAESE